MTLILLEMAKYETREVICDKKQAKNRSVGKDNWSIGVQVQFL